MPCPQFVIWAAAASLLPNVNTVVEYEFYLDGLLQYEGLNTRVEICIDEETPHMLEVVAVHEDAGIQIGRRVARNVGIYVELHLPSWTPLPTPPPTPTPVPEMLCADLNQDGHVGMTDYIEFAAQYGRSCKR